MDKNRLLDMKKEYEKIKIPAELQAAVEKGMERGTKHMRKNKTSNKFIKTLAGVAAAFIVFTMAINVSPVLAEAAEGIPFLGSLVKVLQFDNGEAGGGALTDGTDISDIDAFETEGYETIVINFSQGDIDQENMGSYKVTYNENPYTMTFEIGGARRFSAESQFEKILQNENVKDIYKIITLDDSLIRFAIVFNNPVEYKVQEMKDPASLVVSVKEDTGYRETKSYSLRTESYPYGETIGVVEERFMFENDTRVLKDENGLYLVEIGSFDTKEAADRKLAELNTDIKLFVEERTGADMPKSYPAEEKTENNTEEEQEQPETEKALYSVSITEDGNQYYGDVEILEDGLNIYSEDSQVKLLKYQDVELAKLTGEASFILDIKTSDTTISISGLYNDFFDELEKFAKLQ